MAAIQLSEKQKELIEKLGIMFERSGMTPAQTRIIALLMISDRVELSFDEIRETLQLSKSATSNSLNTLLITDRITYTTKIGDRKRYFKSKIATFGTDFEKQFNQLIKVKEIFQEILESRTKETPEFNSKMAKLIDFLDYFQQEFPAFMKKWETRQ